MAIDYYVTNPNPDNISAFLKLGNKTKNTMENIKNIKLINDYDFTHNNPDNISQFIIDNDLNKNWWQKIFDWILNQGAEFYIVIGGALLLLAIFDEK